MVLAAYLDAMGMPAPHEPVFRTRRGPDKPLTYWAMRRVIQRANDPLGTNWSLHDLRHTAAERMANDPNLTLVEVRAILRHADLATTGRYLHAPRRGPLRRPPGALRSPPPPAHHRARLRFAGAELKAAPAPLPSTPPGPFGDLSRAPASEILRIVERVTKGQQTRGGGPPSGGSSPSGDTWQERWQASGFDDEAAEPVRVLAPEGDRRDSADLTAGLKLAFCLRVIRRRSPASALTSSWTTRRDSANSSPIRCWRSSSPRPTPSTSTTCTVSGLSST